MLAYIDCENDRTWPNCERKTNVDRRSIVNAPIDFQNKMKEHNTSRPLNLASGLFYFACKFASTVYFH